MGMFDTYDNLNPDYIPDNTTPEPSEKYFKIDKILPRPMYSIKNNLVGYSWTNGEFFDFTISVDNMITINSDSLIYEKSGEKPDELTVGEYKGQKAYNTQDVKSWTFVGRSTSNAAPYMWIEDKELTYPTDGDQGTIGTFYNNLKNDRSMKKLIPLLFAAFALTACEKDADTDKLDNKFVVYTNYDKSANFKQFNTYYVPDSILIIGDKDQKEYWKDANAQKIIDTYVFNMDNRGYTRVTEREEADLGLQISYVKNTYVFTDYGYPEWWWGYPGYWDVPYWGNWGGGWYYPYAVSYAYSTGSFLTELLNLEAPQGQTEKLPILWSAYMSGMLSGSTEVNVELAAQAVSQAFTQSAYLTNK